MNYIPVVFQWFLGSFSSEKDYAAFRSFLSSVFVRYYFYFTDNVGVFFF